MRSPRRAVCSDRSHDLNGNVGAPPLNMVESMTGPRPSERAGDLPLPPERAVFTRLLGEHVHLATQIRVVAERAESTTTSSARPCIRGAWGPHPFLRGDILS